MPIGFIQDELDLKLLILFFMDRTAGPITFLQLFELALCDAGVDYFSLAIPSPTRAGGTVRSVRAACPGRCAGTAMRTWSM